MDSCTNYSDSESKKLFSVLMIMQAEEERKVFSEKASEKMVVGDSKRKNAAPGNATKRMKCNDKDASGSSTVEPRTRVIVKFSVSDRAKMLEQTLLQQSPCFVKLLKTSDMHGGEFLDVPENFCDKLFPRHEGSPVAVDFILVDEDDLEYTMSYSFRTRRFLGKWRDFCLKHKLASGDALVFNQTGNCRIKVYSLKASESTEDAQANGNSSNLDIHDNSCETGSTRNTKLLIKHQIITESIKRKLGQMEDERTALREEGLRLEELTKSMMTRKSLLGYFEEELDTLKKECRELEFMIRDVDSAR